MDATKFEINAKAHMHTRFGIELSDLLYDLQKSFILTLGGREIKLDLDKLVELSIIQFKE